MKKSGADRPLKVKIDLHVHTIRSPDAFTSIDELLSGIKRSELDGVAITDHNILAANVPQGALIIKGIEISSRDGHIIGLGVSAPIPRGLSGDETLRQIRQLGGISIIPHPYDLFRSAVNPETLSTLPDAVEVVNSASMLHRITWKRARKFAEKNELPRTAGSDSHIPETIGRAFTTIDCEERTEASVLKAIKAGQTSATGAPYRVADRLRKVTRRRRALPLLL